MRAPLASPTVPAANSRDVETLDEVIALLARDPESDEEAPADTSLLLEHLHAARTHLLGAMTVEYQMSLDLAQNALDAIPDHPVCQRVNSLLKSVRAPAGRQRKAKRGS